MAEKELFVGRERELLELRTEFEAAAASSGRLVVVTGETGIGKSRLVEEFCREAEKRGARVASGAAIAGASAIPYGLLADAVRSSLTAHGHDLAHALALHHRTELTALAPELRADVLAERATGPFAQLRFFEGVAAYLRALEATESPGVLILEDLHWADDGSVEFLAYLAPTLLSARLLVIATVRSEDLDKHEQVRHLLLQLLRQGRAALLELEPLQREDAAAVAAASGPLARRLVDEIVDRGGGNPYFIQELARAVTDPHGQAVLPRTVRALVAERARGLPAPLLRVLQLAATHGVSGSLELVGRAGLLPGAEMSHEFRELRERGLLAIEDSTYAFRQPLLAEVVLEDLLPAERRELHRALADAMGDWRHPDHRGSSAALVLARHLYEGGAGAEAAPALFQAAGVAFGMHAFAMADALYERALAVASRGATGDGRGSIGFRMAVATDEVQGDVLRRAAQAASYAGRPRRAITLIERALSNEAIGSDDRAFDEDRLGRYLLEAGDLDLSLAAYESAAGRKGVADEARCRLLVGYARALLLSGQHEAVVSVGSQAVQLAVNTRSVVDELAARSSLGAALAMVGRTDEGMRELETARRLQSMVGSASRVAQSRIADLLSAYVGTASGLKEAGRPEASAGAAIEGQAVAARLGVGGMWGGVLATTAAAQLFDLGRWSEAEDVVGSLVAAGGDGASAGRVVLARMAVARGMRDVAAGILADVEVGQLSPGAITADYYGTLAELMLAGRELTQARSAVEEGLSAIESAGDRVAGAQLAALGLRIEAERALDARSRRSTADLAEVRAGSEALLATARAALSDGPGAVRGNAFRSLAEAEHSRLAGRSDPERWEDAIGQFGDARMPYQAAYARLRGAESVLIEGRSRKRAEELLEAAHETAIDLGVEPLVREIQELATRARVSIGVVPAADPPPPSAAHALGLSVREMEVLALVVDGRTNREIANELFITEKTAGHHVSSILAKLGVRSRVEAAAIGIRAGVIVSTAR